MRNSLYIILSLLVITLLYCEPPVVFTEPQPQGFTPESSFSIFYRGSFFCESDSSIVVVTKEGVYKKKSYPFVLTKSAIDTMRDLRLEGKRIYIVSTKEWIPATIIGEKVFGELTRRDTLFEIDKEQVLTKFRGHEILNKKRKDGHWEIAILSLDENMGVELSVAEEPNDIERLKEITSVKDISRGDTVQYLITPTVYEFNQILDEDLIFRTYEYYKRMASLIEL